MGRSDYFNYIEFTIDLDDLSLRLAKRACYSPLMVDR